MPTVGEVLRTERERQGRTLKEISDALNIKRQYLAALEEDRYDDIPGVVFVKGFIRNYGNKPPSPAQPMGKHAQYPNKLSSTKTKSRDYQRDAKK